MTSPFSITIPEFIYDLKSNVTDKDKIGAITAIAGLSLIIAGPGASKTKTLVERVVYLILNGTPSRTK